MSASSVDTAELPLVAPPATFAVVVPPPVLGRIALRAERRQARRQRQLYALLGMAVLAAVLVVTVVVLAARR